MSQETSEKQASNQPGPISLFLHYLLFILGITALILGLIVIGMLSSDVLSGKGYSGDGWGPSYAAAGNSVLGFIGIICTIVSFAFFYFSTYFKSTKYEFKILLSSFIILIISIFLIPFLLDKIGNTHPKSRQNSLTLRSTRTPPALPSALSQLSASSAPLSASVQAGPVNFIR